MMTIGPRNLDVRPSPGTVLKPGLNEFQIFEKLTLKHRITQQTFLQNGAKIYTSHS